MKRAHVKSERRRKDVLPAGPKRPRGVVASLDENDVVRITRDGTLVAMMDRDTYEVLVTAVIK